MNPLKIRHLCSVCCTLNNMKRPLGGVVRKFEEGVVTTDVVLINSQPVKITRSITKFHVWSGTGHSTPKHKILKPRAGRRVLVVRSQLLVWRVPDSKQESTEDTPCMWCPLHPKSYEEGQKSSRWSGAGV
ncbi:hypothetical protein AVEN_145521-1 [Araneus ventricosus]|uniref:Uncharacterized protein n=1 Tax=Araneus ventricosus TaxID=182803 RepID=A0A4Y2IJ66_ARAVE|nr:hypothetical protein AVEN_145521-1 [Araneus ventricosus]